MLPGDPAASQAVAALQHAHDCLDERLAEVEVSPWLGVRVLMGLHGPLACSVGG